MFKKLICLILILKLTQARYAFVPKFYGQDSAIIVDTDKSLPPNNNINYPNKIRMPPPFPLWRHYPRYHIIPPPPPGQILAINTWGKTANAKPLTIPTTPSTTTTSTSTTTTTTTSTTTTTTTPKPITTTIKPIITKFPTSSPFITDDEFPSELLDIAQNKLGLKSLDEIPSISELGQLLGTNSPEETLSYIKQLTSNDQGVALMKAYIESTDYTDNSGDLVNEQKETLEEDQDEEDDEEDIGDIEEPLKINNEGLIVINDADSNEDYELNNEDEIIKPTLKPRKTPKIIKKLKELPQTHPSLMERLENFLHLNNFFHKNKHETMLTESTESHQINRISENGKKVNNKQTTLEKDIQENQTESEITSAQDNKTQQNQNLKTPILIRETIPYNYPVPLRVSSSTSTTTTPAPISNSPSSNTPVIHLNTPKMLIPHVQQLSRVTKIPSKKIEDFLASKPKLLELATKVSRFPIGYDRNSPVEAQVMAAVQKAIEQDEDLKKLLSSTATLK